MNKAEFLETLSRQLASQLTTQQIQSHLRYYNDYITSETAKGKTEEEVLEELGDPRLIARTLIDTSELDAGYTYTYNEETFSDSEEPENEPPHRQNSQDFIVRHLDLTTWKGKAILILGAAAVLFIVFSLLSLLTPIILVFVLICIIVTLLRRR